MTAALAVASLSKRYGSETALHNVTFDLEYGDFALLLGSNGAGKSTLLRILAQLGRADKGEVKVNGEKSSAKMISHFGFISHEPMIYGSLTVRENLELAAALTGSGSPDEQIEQWELAAHEDKLVSELSKGLAFRTGLARALLSNPRFLLLDEPSASLDLNSIEILKCYLLNRRADGKTAALISTHDFSRLSGVENRLLILKKGELAYDSGRVEKIVSQQVGALYLEHAH